MLAFSAMTVSILLTLFVRLGHEVFVYVQRSFGFVFLLASYHVFTTDGAKADSHALNAYIGTLATLGIAAFAYRSLFANLLVRRHRYRVAEVNRLDELVTEVVMEPVAKPLTYVPGQFVFVNFRSDAMRGELRPFELSAERQVFSIRAGEIGNQFHPFSITSAPGEPKLRITVKAVGDYTRALRAARARRGRRRRGRVRRLRAPDRRAAGSPDLDRGRNRRHAVPQHGAEPRRRRAVASTSTTASSTRRRRSSSRSCASIARGRDDFRVVLVPRDRDGFLTATRLAAEQPDLASRGILICGPPAMIVSLRAQLRDAGVADGQIDAEEFGFANPRADGAPPRWSDGQVLAMLAAFVLTGLGVAALIVAFGGGGLMRDERRVATGVLVVGTGAAGLRAAIELAERGVQVLCVGKRRRDDAHTVLAAGGINAALGTMDPEDSWEQHAADTLRDGYWLGEPRSVEILCREAPAAIEDLVQWGARFAREPDGRLTQRFFGAHRYRRTCFAGDYTGREIQRTLVRRAAEVGVAVREDVYVTRLLVHDARVFGAYGFDLDDGSGTVIVADAVVLAAGGHTRI